VASGAKTDRAQLRRLLDVLDAGDVLTVTRLDRLARCDDFEATGK
jgi:DNA invertase Pin-like site-specific DNA recombinase